MFFSGVKNLPGITSSVLNNEVHIRMSKLLLKLGKREDVENFVEELRYMSSTDQRILRLIERSWPKFIYHICGFNWTIYIAVFS